jgi:hypothetical protein
VSEATDRPQDAGRAHRRRGELSTETDELLGRYRAAMRAELAGVLTELEGAGGLTQASLDGTADRPVLGLVARRERWELAIKLARELAGGADVEPPAPADAGASRRAPARAPRLSARDRRQLGG